MSCSIFFTAWNTYEGKFYIGNKELDIIYVKLSEDGTNTMDQDLGNNFRIIVARAHSLKEFKSGVSEYLGVKP